MRLLLKIALGIFCLVILCILGFVFYVIHENRAYRNLRDTHDLKDRVTKLGNAYLKKHQNAALVIGVLQNGHRYLQGFGQVSQTNAGPPNGQTLFQIGSITKVLTGITLARMVNAGTVSLDDPITLFLPPSASLDTRHSTISPITLRHLATHTSGLPRMPENFDAVAKNEEDPYADYKAADLYRDLQAVKLGSKPGKKSDYSNYGFGLLGHLLELKAGKPYEALVLESVCAPLGLTNTVVHLSPEQKARLTPGHDPKGKPVPNWTFDVLAGCGAFHSTADDLLTILEANFHEDGSEISKALGLARKPHFEHWTGNVGLGWQIQPGAGDQIVHWHNGGTGGYVSFMGFDKSAKLGVVILSNYGDAFAGDDSVDEMGMEILKLATKIAWE
jgi:CubicO group peptidase (beta-lactamase class C family)